MRCIHCFPMGASVVADGRHHTTCPTIRPAVLLPDGDQIIRTPRVDIDVGFDLAIGEVDGAFRFLPGNIVGSAAAQWTGTRYLHDGAYGNCRDVGALRPGVRCEY